jgi:hypothetical protein
MVVNHYKHPMGSSLLTSSSETLQQLYSANLTNMDGVFSRACITTIPI